MNITFFIGNGFDLNLGLKTSYKDFYLYFKQKYPENIIAKEINIEDALWADLELAIGEFVSACKSEEEYDSLLNAKEEMDLCLINYLRIENDKFSIIDADKLSTNFKNSLLNINQDFNPLNIKQFEQSLKIPEPNHYIFINFNYTDTVDRIINCVNTKFKPFNVRKISNFHYNDVLQTPLHIHGTLNGNMVLAVNDRTQIKTDLDLPTYKINYLIKSSLNDELGLDNNNRLSSIILNSKYICIFGMSIGQTDKKWWSQVLKWLLNGKDKKLIYYAKNSQTTNRTAMAINRAERTAKQDLLRKLGYIETDIPEALLKQIIVVFNSSIFDLDGVKVSSEKKSKELTTV